MTKIQVPPPVCVEIVGRPFATLPDHVFIDGFEIRNVRSVRVELERVSKPQVTLVLDPDEVEIRNPEAS